MKAKRIELFAVMLMVAIVVGCGEDASLKPEVKVPDDPQGTVQTFFTELSNDNAGVIWSAMPESYQTDVTELVHLGSGHIDKELHNKVFAVLGKLTTVLKEKKQFIMSSEMMANNPDKAALEKNWDAVVKLVDIAVTSELADHDKLATLDVGNFLRGSGSDFLAQMKVVGSLSDQDNLAEKIANATAELVSEDGDNAVVKLSTTGEQPEDLELTKVEGKWVPAQLARDWEKNMAEAREDLASADPAKAQELKTQMMPVLAGVDTALDQMLAASTQKEFDTAMQGMMGPIMMMMGGGFGAPAGGPGFAPPPNF